MNTREPRGGRMRIRVSGITLCTWGWWPVAGGKRPEAQALPQKLRCDRVLSGSASEAGRRAAPTKGRRRETHSAPSCAHHRAVARHDGAGALVVPAKASEKANDCVRAQGARSLAASRRPHQTRSAFRTWMRPWKRAWRGAQCLCLCSGLAVRQAWQPTGRCPSASR